MPKSKKKPTPREARTFEQINGLLQDCLHAGPHCLLVCDGCVKISDGYTKAASVIRMPRKTFEAFIDWYNTGKYRKPRKKKGAKP